MRDCYFVINLNLREDYIIMARNQTNKQKTNKNNITFKGSE